MLTTTAYFYSENKKQAAGTKIIEGEEGFRYTLWSVGRPGTQGRKTIRGNNLEPSLPTLDQIIMLPIKFDAISSHKWT